MGQVSTYESLARQFLSLLKTPFLRKTIFDVLLADGASIVRADMALESNDRTAPLDVVVRSEYENLLGADLSEVIIHTGPYAHELTRNSGARALTIGSHIYFADGEYAPDTEAGKTLLAHELTHVAQFAKGMRLVYLEDVAAAEYEGGEVEAELGGYGLHELGPRFDTREGLDVHGRGEDDVPSAGLSGLGGTSAVPGQGLEGFSASGGVASIQVRLGDGRSHMVSLSDYQRVVEGVAQGARSMLSDARMELTETEYEAFVLRWCNYWKGPQT